MRRMIMRCKLRSFLILGIWLALLGPLSLSAQSQSSGNSQVSFINVGQGDAALIQDGHGFDILIDGGPVSAGASVVQYLRAHGVTSLEVMLNSHADADHVGGLIAVLQASDIAIGSIYTNGYPGKTATWDQFVAAANARSLPLRAAQFPAEMTWGDFRVYILNPPTGLSNPDQNDASVVARLDFNATRFLFPGDIDSTIEARVVARQTPLAANVLKVAHHGSAYSSSAAFLAAVDPDHGVISVGSNPYGHPAAQTLARLAAQAVTTWRTDQTGALLFVSDGIQVISRAGSHLLYLPALIQFDPPAW